MDDNNSPVNDLARTPTPPASPGAQEPPVASTSSTAPDRVHPYSSLSATLRAYYDEELWNSISDERRIKLASSAHQAESAKIAIDEHAKAQQAAQQLLIDEAKSKTLDCRAAQDHELARRRSITQRRHELRQHFEDQSRALDDETATSDKAVQDTTSALEAAEREERAAISGSSVPPLEPPSPGRSPRRRRSRSPASCTDYSIKIGGNTIPRRTGALGVPYSDHPWMVDVPVTHKIAHAPKHVRSEAVPRITSTALLLKMTLGLTENSPLTLRDIDKDFAKSSSSRDSTRTTGIKQGKDLISALCDAADTAPRRPFFEAYPPPAAPVPDTASWATVARQGKPRHVSKRDRPPSDSRHRPSGNSSSSSRGKGHRRPHDAPASSSTRPSAAAAKGSSSSRRSDSHRDPAPRRSSTTSKRSRRSHSSSSSSSSSDHSSGAQRNSRRQVTPSLASVSQRDHPSVLADNGTMVVYNPDSAAAPLSSRTAHNLHAEQTAQHLRDQQTHVADVASKYPKTDFRNVEPIQPTLPFSGSTASISSALGQFLDTTKRAMMDILSQADPLLDFDNSTAWVRGWERPLHRAIAKTIPRNSADSANLNSIISGFFTQVQQRLDGGTTGGDAFKHLLRLIANQFGNNDRGHMFTALNNFGVENGTTFARFLQLYRVAVANASNYSNLLAPDDSWIVEITRNKINEQYPSLAPLCFPGRLATDPRPYASLDSMWRAFDDLLGNKTPATNGSRFSALPSFDRLSLGSSSSQVRSSGRASHTLRPASTSGRPYVMTVQPRHVADVFDQFYPEWPLGSDDHWETVFNVSEGFTNHNLPPLWTPLTSRQDRHSAFIENSGRCLNCGDTGHSLRHCDRPFTNSSGILNPELGRLNDNGATFQTWLQRMRSHHPSNNNNDRSSLARRNDRRHLGSSRRHDQTGRPHDQHHARHGHQGHADHQAERFRARHVTGYTPNTSTSSGISVYQPHNAGGTSSTAVNHVTSNARSSSSSTGTNTHHRSPYSGRK